MVSLQFFEGHYCDNHHVALAEAYIVVYIAYIVGISSQILHEQN